MSAHEEQISQNRRRLFKALSVTPVVATLSPGSAVAGHSAYQCAAKLRTDTLVPGPNDIQSSVFEEQSLMTWVLTSANRLLRDELDPPEPVWLGGTGITAAELSTGITVVSMDPDHPELGPFYELDGSNFVDRFELGTMARVEVTGDTLTVINKRTSAPYTTGRAAIEATGVPKLYAKVYRTLGGDCGPQDCSVEYLGDYPQVQVDHTVIDENSGGAPQGMSGTCLGSFADSGKVTTGLLP
jgi:hypothetical protein